MQMAYVNKSVNHFSNPAVNQMQVSSANRPCDTYM